MTPVKKPWMKFYPADWRGEPRLRMCSFAARGLWIDLISYMHEGEPYGHLTIEGHPPNLNEIASLTARPVTETRKALAELEARKVFSRSPEGTIYSRRMVRDAEKAMRDKENGSAGGNPNLKPQVNPPDKAQRPEARGQRLEANASQNQSSFKSEDREAKREERPPPRNGQTAPRVGRVYVTKGTPEWEAYAADYRSVHHREPDANKHGGKWFRTLGEGQPVVYRQEKTG